MPPQIAALACFAVIVGFFALDRDRHARTSKALWIPVLWLLINGSRPVSQWLQSGPTIDSPDKYLDGSPIDAAVFGVLLTVGFGVLIMRGKRVRTVLRANGPLVLFFSYCALSILWSEYPFVAFKRWTKSVGDIVMVLVVLTDPDRYSALKRLLTRTSFLLIPLSVLLIKYYPDLGRSYNPWTWIPMYCGVTTFKNLLGMICLVCGIASLWRFLGACRKQQGRRRVGCLIAHGSILLMVFWLFWMANSMTSLSCFAMAGGLLLLTSLLRGARKPMIVHFLVAVILVLPLFALFSGSGGGMVESLGRDPTLTGRTEIWNVVISLSGNPFLGTGFESFWLGDRLQRVWDLTMKGLQEAHNGYLEVYLNLGWIGVILLVVFIIRGYRHIVVTLREDPEIGRLNLAFLAASLVYSFSEAGFRMMSPTWLSLLLATVAVPNLISPPGALVGDKSRGRLWPDLSRLETQVYEGTLDTV